MIKRMLMLFIVGLFIAAIAWGAWDKDKPAAGTSLRSSNPEILANNTALQTALDAEHDFGGSTQTGSHTPGSARAFFQDDAPTTQIDGDAFAATDLGSLWFDTNATPDNLYYVLTAYAGSGTWTKVSVSLIAEIVATANTWGAHQTFGAGFDLKGSATSDILWNNFTVAGATGNTLVPGTLDVTGNIDPTTYETTNGGFLDEDAMGSDAADKICSQQSIKAYVDADHPAYSGGESHTDGSGLIFKQGIESVAGNTTDTVTFTDAFSNGVVSGSVTKVYGSDGNFKSSIAALTKAHIQIRNEHNSTANIHWQAWGY